MVPVNGRLPTYSATKVWFPRHTKPRTCDLLDVGVPSHTSTTGGHGLTARRGRCVPEPTLDHHARLACLAYSVLNVPIRTSGQKKRGLASPGPLSTPWVSRGSSSCSHTGASGPGDERLGSCQITLNVLAGYTGLGRRRRQASRLRASTWSSGRLGVSWRVQHTRTGDSVSRCQNDFFAP